MTTSAQTLSISRWTIFTFYGWFVGILILIFLSSVVEGFGLRNFQFFIGTGMSLGVGFFQWRFLRKYAPITSHFIWLSVLGLTATFLAYDIYSYLTTDQLDTYFLPVCIFIGSLFSGFLQHKTLYTFSSRTNSWILGSVMAWTLAGATVLCMDLLKPFLVNRWVGFFTNLFLILAGGVVLGLVSGVFLRRIINRSANI